jgi:hypothetical protein
MSIDHELQLLRKQRRADQATIEGLTSTLTKLQRAARAVNEENAQLRRSGAESALGQRRGQVAEPALESRLGR